MMMVVREIAAKSVLCRSGIAGADFAINPYVGCQHSCVYCYAVFMKRFSSHEEPWGTFVDVKANAPSVLEREIRRHPAGSVFLSSVTDPYQPLECDYRLTERCLDVLSRYPRPALLAPELLEVSVLTKSDLVLRDLALLARLPNCRVGMTVTTTDDAVAAWVEPGASPPSRRIAALERLHEAGILTWAFLGPLLPYYSDHVEAISDLFERAQRAGVSYVYVDRMNLYPSVKQRLLAAYRAHSREATLHLVRVISDEGAYESVLRERVRLVAGQFDIEVRGFV